MPSSCLFFFFSFSQVWQPTTQGTSIPRPGARASVTNHKLLCLILCSFPKTSLTPFPPARGNAVAGRPMRRSGEARAATEYTKEIVEASPLVVVGAGAAAFFKHSVQVRA